MRLKELIKKYKEIGKMTLTGDRKKNHNNMMEYQRYADMILEEVCRMYEAGELDVIGADR